jgi:class 3 adenylate cyclase/tetratricopeptide (TPR) repeat protein
MSEPSTESLRAASRRHLTVMACDLVNSTQLSRQMDPEDFVQLLGGYRECCCKIIVDFQGFIARFVGDGILAYFGYPAAQENDVERAVRAALRILDALEDRSEQWAQAFQVRIGIATGVVIAGPIIGDSFREHDAVSGDAPVLSTRLQQLAAPNSILVSDETRRLVGDQIDWEPLAPLALKGFEEPVQAWRALGLRSPQSRFSATRATELTPFVNREEETFLLERRWQKVKEGQGQAVVLIGIPGIGKSRLIEQFCTKLIEPHYVFRFQCSQYHCEDPLSPVIGWFKTEAGLSADDSAERVLRKLADYFFEISGESFQSPAWLMEYFVDGGHRKDVLGTEPHHRKEQVLEFLLSTFGVVSRRRHTLFVFEDVHWADATTRELLELLLHEADEVRAFIIVTARPEVSLPLDLATQVTTMTLNSLSRKEAAQIVDAILGPQNLPSAARDLIVGTSDRIPLFVEELSRAVAVTQGEHRERASIDTGGSQEGVWVPATLQDSLTSRIDRMGAAKDALEAAAVIGRDVPIALLSLVADQTRARIQTSVDQLVEAGLLYRRSTASEPIYRFKHALIRDATYTSILKAQRRNLHHRVAHVLETQFGEICLNEPVLLAHHHLAAGNKEAAVEYLLRAGVQATQRCATKDARTLVVKGLTILQSRPPSRRRHELEIDLRSLLGRIHIFEESWAAPSVETEFRRALELSHEIDSVEKSVPVLWALATSHLLAGRIDEAVKSGRYIVSLAVKLGDRNLVSAISAASATFEFHQGNFEEALLAGATALDNYQVEASSHFRQFYGTDRKGQALRGRALALWCLGQIEAALAADEEQRALAEAGGNSFELAYALGVSSLLHSLRRDWEKVQTFASRSYQVARAGAYSFREMRATLFLRMVDACENPRGSKIEAFDKSLKEYQATGNRMGESAFLAVLGEMWGRTGMLRNGRAAIEAGLAYVERSGERFAEAELHRVRGDLHSLSGDRQSAESAYQAALAVATKQKAKSWELRSSIALALYWRARGNNEAVPKILAPVCEWFGEQSSSPELQQARLLLADHPDGAPHPDPGAAAACATPTEALPEMRKRRS